MSNWADTAMDGQGSGWDAARAEHFGCTTTTTAFMTSGFCEVPSRSRDTTAFLLSPRQVNSFRQEKYEKEEWKIDAASPSSFPADFLDDKILNTTLSMMRFMCEHLINSNTLVMIQGHFCKAGPLSSYILLVCSNDCDLYAGGRTGRLLSQPRPRARTVRGCCIEASEELRAYPLDGVAGIWGVPFLLTIL